jgi:hypothetical protein
MQTPQRLDAKHGDEMFLVTGDPSIRHAHRQYPTATQSRHPPLQTQEREGPPLAVEKFASSHFETARHF